MALVNTAPSDKFEMDESDTGTADTATRTLSADEKVAAQAAKNAARSAAQPAEQAADQSQTSTSTAVAAPAKPNALVTAMTKANPFKAMENAIHVDYNTLTRLMCNNGNIINKETKGLFGDTIELQLISFQKHWVMAPGGDSNDEESLQYLKFSDDGKVERETGRPLAEFVDAAMAAGYGDARVQERLILVGEIVNPGKLKDMQGELVQMDLAPRSVRNFNTYQLNAAFKVAKGLLTAEQATRLKITADVQSKGKNTWTDAQFSAGTVA